MLVSMNILYTLFMQDDDVDIAHVSETGSLRVSAMLARQCRRAMR